MAPFGLECKSTKTKEGWNVATNAGDPSNWTMGSRTPKELKK
jgi:hypothetical protein